MAFSEVINKRTQKSKHYYDADTNKWRAEFTIADRHYHDGNSWQDVDETLVNDTGGFDKKCDKTRHAFKIASGGNRRWYPRRNVLTEYVDITGMEYYTNKWNNLNLPAAVWKNQGAEWDMSYLYASITNTWRRIKADFILKNTNAPTRLRFAISFTGLTYNNTTGELTSTTDGLVWGYIVKPTAHDANEINVPVTQTYDGAYIEWSVDTTGATFPIVIDPTFTDGYGGDVQTYKDTFIQLNSHNNDGINPELQFQSNNFKSLLQFDLSSISSSNTCDSATLYLYKVSSSGSFTDTVTIYSIASGNNNWVEGNGWGWEVTGASDWYCRIHDTSTWSGSAGLSTADTDYETPSIGSISISSSDDVGAEKSSSLTNSRIEDWFGASNTNYGILLTIGNVNYYLGSSDHATTGYRPKLVVEYTEGDVETVVVMEVNTVPVVVDVCIVDNC